MKRTEAPGNVGNLYVDRNIQMGTAGTILMAEDRNNIQEEICNPILTGGAALDGNDQHQLEKSIIALSRQVGELILTDVELTPKEYAGATGADYCPVIPRHDADHDIDDTVVPQSIIDKLNAVKWAFNGQKNFSCTVSGNSVVVENTTEGNALVAALVEQGMVNRWYNTGEDPDYASQGALYSGKRSFCLTIATVDYEITGVNALTNTITVGENPGDGVKTMSIYPHRIAGVNASRLRRISGEVLSSASKDSINIVAGHKKAGIPNITASSQFGTGSGSARVTPYSTTGAFYASGNGFNSMGNTLYNDNMNFILNLDASRASPVYNDANTVQPNAYDVYIYTHLRYLLSTNWTSN